MLVQLSAAIAVIGMKARKVRPSPLIHRSPTSPTRLDNSI